MTPRDEEIHALHKKHAKTDADFDLIYTHCKIVDAIAMQILDAQPSLNIDRNLVHVGCLLHDIGAYDVLEDGKFVKGVRHGVIGEEILKSEGYPEVIWRFASHHTGVGLTKKDIIEQNIPIPVADYLAETDEERLIMYADKFHTKNNPPNDPPHFCTYESYRHTTAKFKTSNADTFDAYAKQFGKPELALLSIQFGQDIRELNYA